MLVYASVSIALAFVLSYIVLPVCLSGSITPGSMLPIAFAPIWTHSGYPDRNCLPSNIQDACLVHWAQLLMTTLLPLVCLVWLIYTEKPAAGSFIAVFARFRCIS